MKLLVVFAVAVACASAYPSETFVPIVRSSNEVSPDGNSFQYGFESGDGTISQVEGVVKNPNTEDAKLEVKGSVRYTSPEGILIDLLYVADENGFAPAGSHLPVAPPTPEAILRALDYIRAHPAPVETFVAKKF